MFSLEFEDIQRQHLSNLKMKVWRTSVSDPLIYTWEPCRHQNKCWNLLKMLTWCRKKSFINSFINCLNLVWIEHNLDLDRWRTKELSVTIFFLICWKWIELKHVKLAWTQVPMTWDVCKFDYIWMFGDYNTGVKNACMCLCVPQSRLHSHQFNGKLTSFTSLEQETLNRLSLHFSPYPTSLFLSP